MMSRIFAVVALLIAASLFFLYVSPTWLGSITAARAKIAADDQALAAATSYASKENQLVSAEKQIDPQSLARLNQFLPNSPDDVELILNLDSLAARSGLSLSGVSVADTPLSGSGTASNGKAYNSIDLSLAATGSYASFRTFLSAIEHSSRILDISSLTVGGSNTGVYTYSMTLRLYWLQ